MRLSLIPRNNHFFDLFDALARQMVQCSECLVDMLQHFESIDQKTARLKDIEHEADNITHDIYRLVYQTRTTPFARQDIIGLAQSMDDVVDFLEAAGSSVRVYGIDSPTPGARGLADIARLQTLQLETAIPQLRQRRSLKGILEQAKEINRLENEADSLFLAAMSDLFHGEAPVMDVIKWRDIYDSLERATDACERVAHGLEAIVLKHG